MTADATPGEQQLTVVKLGGSLLDLPDLTARLATVLSSIARPLIIVGGGRAADQVRFDDATFGLGNLTAHWLAIQAMAFNARQLCRADRRLAMVSTVEQARFEHQAGHIPVIDVVSALKREERNVVECERLPASWGVTSDSIAAWLAGRWNASLLLLKSVDRNSEACNTVDRWFGHTAGHLTAVRWINLRSEQLQAIGRQE